MQPFTEMTIQLPPGVILRRPDRDDLEAIAHLIILIDLAERGESDVSLEDIELDWQRPDFNPHQDAWLAIASQDMLSGQAIELQKYHPQPIVRDGLLIGYEEVTNRDRYLELRGDGYVHPHFKNRGIGTALLRIMEARARLWLPEAPAGSQVLLRNGVSAADMVGVDLHHKEGYHPARYFWVMETDPCRNHPARPERPAGLQIRNCIPGQDDRPLFEAIQEAFRDHWGFAEWDYDWWHARMMEREAFDPNLWFLALDGQEIAGAALGRLINGQGWISQLAVRRPWRQRGLGLGLLRRSLQAFEARQVQKVGLSVDAASPTGATRLYEKAGMAVVHQYILFEKELRSGEGSLGISG